MTGYRLRFATSDPRITSIEDTLIQAQYTLGDVTPALAEAGSILSNDYLVQIGGVAQFIVRFEAPSDEVAYAAATAALDAIRSIPVDSVALDRRSRRYVPVNAV